MKIKIDRHTAWHPLKSLILKIIHYTSKQITNFLNLKSLPVLIVTLSWLLSVVSRLIKSGDVYGMDFGLFHPDGTNYLKFTQDIVGMNIQDSTIYAWSRPLYPVLSVPFFLLLGKHGMLVIPAVSYFFFGLTLLKFGRDRRTRIAIASMFLIISSSSTLLRWVVADLTDSLHLFLFTLCCLGVYRRWKLEYLIVIAILGSLARPMGMLWAALFFAIAIRPVNRSKRKFHYLSLFSLSLFFVNTLVMGLYGGFGPNSKNLIDQVTSVPVNFISLIVVEFGQLAVMDRVLFYFILFSFTVAILNYRDSWSLVHLCVTVASFLLSAWIGVWGVNFRYQLPLLTTAIVVILRMPVLKRMLDSS